jgi:hypothetical protein
MVQLIIAISGVPKSELAGGLRSSSKLPLTWTPDDLRRHIMTLFPRVRNFVYMKCNQGKTLDPLPDDIKPADLRNLLGRSGLYIVPTGPLLPKVNFFINDIGIKYHIFIFKSIKVHIDIAVKYFLFLFQGNCSSGSGNRFT